MTTKNEIAEAALQAGRKLTRCEPGEEVVITGIAGRFPGSDSVRHLGENLFAKKILTTENDNRAKFDHPKFPKRIGQLNDLNKFDAVFFGIHQKQADQMDPMGRILLEKAFEAIIDSGYNPKKLRDTKTGVFVGVCYTESEKAWFTDQYSVDSLGIIGCSRAMLANRISYWLGVNGPSYSVDSACSSSLFALDHAYKAIRDGVCEAAIVAGCNLCLNPCITLQFSHLGALSTDGICKSFDESADGYGRSEAVTVLFLQKAKAARRIYARVVHTKTNCDGYKEQGITFPSSSMQQQLYEEFYQECEVDPKSLSYIEAHGTGTRVGDPVEIKAIESVFCNGRTTPLRIGAVKSNMGHSEPASGLCSVTKVVLAFEHGVIPPNINLIRPRSDIPALHNGKITVVSEPCPWDSGPSGINSFGFGGANCHVLLTSNPKKKVNDGLPVDDLPRLVFASGRTTEAVDFMLTELENRPLDVEFVRLMHEVFSDNIQGHTYRGYTIINRNGRSLLKHQEHFSGVKRPIWFIFAGMGSHWPTMGKSLMKIQLFAESIQKSHRILEPKGVDLIRIITANDKTVFDNILNSFVGIAAIQIALVDILRAVGIVPDGIIGHSVGELGCAYADGCFTAEQMILVAYYRGLASVKAKLIHGSMASIGIGYEAAKSLVPPEIDIACHNGPDNCTISGRSEDIKKLVDSLTAKGIFTKVVNVSNIAYHSRYIASAGSLLLSYLKKVIPEPKLRSNKWISSSNLETTWSTEKAMFSSAEYHTNNLLSSVYFEESSRHIPSNAIAIEIAPHGLLQAILKRSLNQDVSNIPLTSRNCRDNLEFLLQSFGKIYEAGIDFKVHMLYPLVEFPVSKGTPMIAPLVRWEHSEDRFVMTSSPSEKINPGLHVTISLQDIEYEYLSGHVVDGRNQYPATGYLMLAWETVSSMRNSKYHDVSVEFEDIRFHRATNIPKEGTVEFMVMVHGGSGSFEIVEGGAVVVMGRISVQENPKYELIDLPSIEEEENPEILPLSGRDVYKELRLRGYNYEGLFKGITYANNIGTVCRILWANNFVTFMDNVLQIRILNNKSRGLFVPTFIQRIVVNVKKHFNILKTLDKDKPEFTVFYHKDIDLIECGGIEVHGLTVTSITKKKSVGVPVLEKYQFVPYLNTMSSYDFKEVVRICTHIVLENLQTVNVSTIELLDSFAGLDGPLASKIIADVLHDEPLIQAEIVVLGSKEHPLLNDESTEFKVEDEELPNDQSVFMVTATGILKRKTTLQEVFKSLNPRGFLLCREKLDDKLLLELEGLDICLDYNLQNERVLLVRKNVSVVTEPVIIKLSKNTLSWVPEIQKHISSLDTSNNQNLILYAEKESQNGIIGFINCLRREHSENIRCFFILDETAPTFSIKHPLYKSQLAKDLAMNVYKNGVWGSYRHLLLENKKNVQTSHAYVNTMIRGNLTSLRWVEGRINPDMYKEDSEYNLVHVYFAPLNFKDVMFATERLTYEELFTTSLEQIQVSQTALICCGTSYGNMTQANDLPMIAQQTRVDDLSLAFMKECVHGFEYVGRDINGTRYMGISKSGAMSTLIKCDVNLRWRIPDHWTMEEAATIPVVYGTVLYALFICARIQQGDSILIHAGSGGVGQAAINICLHYKCEIFTTVSTQEKRNFIRKTFPQIPDNHIGNSRNTSFETLIRRETNGKGVKFVLNSLSEEKLQASMRCLSAKGSFLEIGRFDLAQNNSLGMRHFLNHVSFHGIMLDEIFNESREGKEKLQTLLQREIENGAVKPLVRTVFTPDRVEDAFRYMTSGKHIGKVVLKIRDEEKTIDAKPVPVLRDAVPRYNCDSEKTYIICGGLGGFGIELAEWLVTRGARNLLLTSRTGIRTGFQSMRVRIWRSYGVNVVISTDDITEEEGVRRLLDKSNELGPVDGIFNLAVVLRDALFENQTEESFAASAGPKSTATRHLDKLSRKMCPSLRQFVVFSSVSCGRGNMGQTNYGLSNSAMERICEMRQASGFPGLAIEWGAVGEVGLVADMADNNLDAVISGTLQQRINSCLETMDLFMKQANPIVSSMVVAEKQLQSSASKTIVDTVANILALRDLKSINVHSTLTELGMDSMTAVEIKQCLEREFNVFLTLPGIRSLTFNKLNEMNSGSIDGSDKNQITKAGEQPTDTCKSDIGPSYLTQMIDEESYMMKPVVRLPSLADDGCVEECSVAKTPTVFVFPGIDGVSNFMIPLATNLNMQVLCLQYNYEQNDVTFEELANSLLMSITRRLPKTEQFQIVGYSFGGVLAMMVVKLLEEEGYTGRLWLLNSAPEAMKLLLSSVVSYDEIDPDEIQIKVILHIMNLFSLQPTKQLENELQELTNWNSRLDKALLFIPAGVKRRLFAAAYNRSIAYRSFKGFTKNFLKTSAILIRPADEPFQTKDSYDLSQESTEAALRAGRKLTRCEPGDEVVITGIAGKFPNSNSVQHFGENLYAKKNLTTDTDRRGKYDHPDFPQRIGQLDDLNRFDAIFFGIHPKQADRMDPMGRILLEKTFEAVIDSGYNPKTLRGSNTGVFVGVCYTESEKMLFSNRSAMDGALLIGCSRAVLANRLSYWLGVHGPSYSVDTACSSSSYALDHAYKAIRDGLCEAAIVAGCNLCLNPNITMQFANLGVLSHDGLCKSFDETSDGYARSEAVVVLFLQKAKAARRIYARVVHTKTNCDGFKEQGITFPSSSLQQQLFEEFYEECGVDPKSLSYMEAHGTGTKVGDPEEIKAIESVFCNGRTTPLRIGTVKSNMGHSEPVSGLCSIAKVILAFELGIIPPNINLVRPRSDIPAFHNGKITIVTEACPWDSGPSAINSFGFGGANSHILLMSNQRQKVNDGLPFDDLPRLVLASGRTEEAIDVMLTNLENRSLDVEYVRLMHEVFSDNIPGHTYRGYNIVSKNSGSLIKHQEYFPGHKRPVWFVFSGMGSQWPTMGKSLMQIPLFAESIQKCHRTLKPKGVDLIQIITEDDRAIFGNILNSFVGIAAIQIALVDILRAIDIVPDGIIGHSVGELGCAYADGCFTAEQMILAAYYRGLASLETKLIIGCMASIGVGYDTAKSLVPPEIDIACHNSSDNCTISGPSENVKKFVESLTAKGIFAKVVNVSNIAYHSRYIANAGPVLLSYLKEIIPEPKLRSNKWISSSNLETDWSTEKAMFSSAEYHTKQKQIYEAGIDFKAHMLYPPIEFPVSKGTQMIAPLVRWDHSEDRFVVPSNPKDLIKTGERNVIFSLQDPGYEYLSGHVVDGRNLYPAAGYLVLAWETISSMRSLKYDDVSVEFEDVRFHRATNIPKEGTVDFMVMVHRGSGSFEIVEAGAVVVSGRISLLENEDKEYTDLPPLVYEEDREILPFNGHDVYKEFRLRGYNYKGLFTGITYMNNTCTVGRILWADNFVAFIDNVLQMPMLTVDTRNLYIPTSIRKVVINPKKHYSILRTLNKDKPEFTLSVYKEIGLFKCGGIEVYGTTGSPITKKKLSEVPVLEKYQFVPNFDAKSSYDFKEVIRICTHIVLENSETINVNTIELVDSFASLDGPLVSQVIADVLHDQPFIQADTVVLGNKDHPLLNEEITGLTIIEDKDLPNDESVLMVVATGVLNRKKILQEIFESLKPNGFLLCREKLDEKSPTEPEGLDICFSYDLRNERLLLVKKNVSTVSEPVIIKLSENTFSWIPEVQKHISNLDASSNQNLLLYAEKESQNGILGFVNCLRREQHGGNIRCFFIQDEAAPTFSIKHPLYKTQLAKGLAMNVYKNGVWGSYRHLLLKNVKNVQTPHAYVSTMVRGDLTSLRWVEGRLNPDTYKKYGEHDLMHIYFAPLNFRDVMFATGKLAYEEVFRNRLEQECVQGLEYVGRDINGVRYMGITKSGSLSTLSECDVTTRWRIPDHWTMEEAATIPVAYGTALYALFICGRMQPGDSVLIHAGSGGVGQAAINICLHYKCEIFTTVGTQEKRDFIRKTFPQIPDSHIGNSRDTSFEPLVMRETNGKGVKFVLNSLAEEKLQASLRCLGRKGTFLEIGKFDLAKNNNLGMRHFLNHVSFHGVMLDQLPDDSREAKEQLVKLLQREIESGAVKPLVRTVFTADRVEDAFRYMASGKHIGKVVLKIRDEETAVNAKSVPVIWEAVPRYHCDPEKTYIICGGLGGFGLELADWLITRGARNLMLSSRTGLRTGYQAMRIRIWRSYGVNVVLSTDDITKEDGVRWLLEKSNELGMVDGIFNLAVVLRDSLFENQTEESFAASIGPKATATQYLDKLSRKMCPALRQFVVFSSISCGRGNVGQTNYGLANSMMERICEIRRASGFPGMAIEWGAIGDVGLVTYMAEENSDMVKRGTLEQRIHSCLETMDLFMAQNNPIVASMVVAEKRLQSSGSETIVDAVAKILAIRDLKSISLHSTLAELGMDSMTVVEIKQCLEREFEVFLTTQDIRSLTFNKLHEISASVDGSDKTEITNAAKQLTDTLKTDIGGLYLAQMVDEESHAMKPIVRIPSLADDGCADECPVTKTPTVFIFPGLEGISKYIVPLARNLKMQVLCLQYNYKYDATTIEELTDSLATSITSRLPKTEQFQIVGHSFGGVVVMKVVKLLEEEGYTGRLWLLDGAPELVKTVLTSMFSYDEKDPGDMQVKVILHFMGLFSLQPPKELANELHQLTDWNSRLNKALLFKPAEVKLSDQYLRRIFTAAYNRAIACVDLKGFTKNFLKTSAILIRPADVSIQTEDSYHLSQYFESSVQVHFVKGNHFTMLENKEVAAIINDSVS